MYPTNQIEDEQLRRIDIEFVKSFSRQIIDKEWLRVQEIKIKKGEESDNHKQV